MIKNRAFEVIQTFSPKELKSFELFVKSPFHNSNKSLVKLLAVVKKYTGRFHEEEITEEFIYNKIFPGRKYSYGNMKNLVSELFGLCEKFLSVISPVDTGSLLFEQGLKRIENYNVRGLDKLFFAEYKELEKKLENSFLTPEYYFNKSRLVEKLYKFYTRRSQYTGALDTFYPMSIYNTCYMISTLKHDVAGMEYLKSQVNYVPEVNITDAFYRNFNFEKFLDEVKGIQPALYEYMSIDIKLMKLYNEPDNFENYNRLKDFILKNIEQYSNSERWQLTSALFGFILNKYIQESSRELLLEIALLRKTQIKYVKFNTAGLGPLQAGVFRNMVEVFVILGDYEYAESFINENINELEEDKRKSLRSFTMALLEEARGNNEKVLDLLRDVDLSDYQAKYSAKILAIVAFYNLGYIEEGLSAVDSMKHFIRNTDEFSQPMKVNLGERVNIMERLFKIKANPEKYSQSDIDEVLANTEKYIVSRKEWYVKQAEELRSLLIS